MAHPPATTLRRQNGLRLEPQLMREVAHISIDKDKPLSELVKEAPRDLLKKYREQDKGK